MNKIFLLLAALTVITANADDLLIRNATVHTSGSAGSLEGTDILIRNGQIRAVGTGLDSSGVQQLDASGKQITPGLFGGLSGTGLEEISLAASTVDSQFDLPLLRPEFKVSNAYNPNSSLVAITRFDGITQLLLAPETAGSIIAGQGRMVRLDGGYSSLLGRPALLINVGADSSKLTGGSRAAQYMQLRQVFAEAAVNRDHGGPHQILTGQGRDTIRQLIKDRWPVLFDADRASDILQVIAFARAQNIKPVIVSGAEAWMVADQLAAAGVPVILNPLANEPEDFDQLGARLDNAALLHAAGVEIAFTMTSDWSHNARKVRQAAGVAVAYGLPWQASLAALTRKPASIFGLSDRLGTIEVGKQADLVIWNGDPLEVTTVAEQVFIGGRAMPMTSRQTQLRDRYLPEKPERPRAYIK